MNLRKTHCRSCDAPVFFATTPAGKLAIIDWSPVPDGTIEISETRDEHGRKQPLATVSGGLFPGGDTPRYKDHHATCPDAETWRQRAGAAAEERGQAHAG